YRCQMVSSSGPLLGFTYQVTQKEYERIVLGIKRDICKPLGTVQVIEIDRDIDVSYKHERNIGTRLYRHLFSPSALQVYHQVSLRVLPVGSGDRTLKVK
ncbi:MAG TPA: hypothetical protein VLS45_06595, partial [Methylomicrobium sp.]|nr:hypothetical protein [Methylomicrobium sp.]